MMGTKISNADPQRAASVRRTVIVLAVIAVLIYVAFILSGMFGVAGART